MFFNLRLNLVWPFLLIVDNRFGRFFLRFPRLEIGFSHFYLRFPNRK